MTRKNSNGLSAEVPQDDRFAVFKMMFAAHDDSTDSSYEPSYPMIVPIHIGERSKGEECAVSLTLPDWSGS